MRRHPARLSAAGISPARYDELRAICRQYKNYRADAAAIRRGEYDRRRGSGAWHAPDPTGSEALRRADNFAQRRVDAIESAAKAAGDEIGSGMSRYIIKNTCFGVDYDRMIPPPPCGRAQFYRARIGFFILLDGMVGG